MELLIQGAVPAFVFKQNQPQERSCVTSEIGTPEWAVEALARKGGRATFRDIRRGFVSAKKHPEEAERSFHAACSAGLIELYKVQKGRGRPRYEFRLCR